MVIPIRYTFVYNPVGTNLPPPQPELEAEFREALDRDFGIRFHRLFTITNQPIARFAEDLRQKTSGMNTLSSSPTALIPNRFRA